MPIGKSESATDFAVLRPLYTLDDLILSEVTRSEIQDCIAAVKKYDFIFKTWGLIKTHPNVPRSLISLYGLPGTGKTIAAHAIAQALGKDILVVKYADLESKYVGDTPKNIEKLFAHAKASGVVIFFDEADSILSKRLLDSSNAASSNINQTRSTMLNILNNYEGVVIFASNFIENYDDAFFRRMIKHIEFTLPDLNARKQLLEKYTPVEMPHDFSFGEMADKCEGASGADISMAILNAALKAARMEENLVKSEYVMEMLTSMKTFKNKFSKSGSIETKREILPVDSKIKDVA